MYDTKELTEKFAEYAHKQWSGWMKYFFSKSLQNPDGSAIIPAWAVYRWKRQMKTAYAELLEEEKENDRDEAIGMIKVLNEVLHLEQVEEI